MSVTVFDVVYSKLLPLAVWSWPGYKIAAHHRRIAAALEAVERGEITRLIINMPPRHGKSMLASEYFPAWYLGRNPDRYVIHCTYAQEFADDMGRKVRNLMSQPEFACIFPGASVRSDSSSARRFHTERAGTYVAVGAGGPITGRGAHLLLIDDPIKGRDDAESETMRRKLKDWYGSVAYTRLMPESAVVIIQTRWHEDDLSGWLLREHADEGWTVLSLPAINDDDEALWPEAYPITRLMQIKKAIGTRDFEALYQQRPSPGEGGIIKRGWWQYYHSMVSPDTAKSSFDEIIQSWDLAFKSTTGSDFVCGQVWGRTGPDAYLLDMDCRRMGFTETISAIRKMTSKWPMARPVLIEDKANGPAAMSVLRTEIAGIVPVDPGTASKESRVHAVTPMIESGNVFLPSKALGFEWLEDFSEQCAAFPSGANDDMVDAMSQALGRLYKTRQSAGVAVAGARRF